VENILVFKRKVRKDNWLRTRMKSAGLSIDMDTYAWQIVIAKSQFGDY
jgi:hypothetical protein